MTQFFVCLTFLRFAQGTNDRADEVNNASTCSHGCCCKLRNCMTHYVRRNARFYNLVVSVSVVYFVCYCNFSSTLALIADRKLIITARERRGNCSSTCKDIPRNENCSHQAVTGNATIIRARQLTLSTLFLSVSYRCRPRLIWTYCIVKNVCRC